MKHAFKPSPLASYLDVSEYILKEHSPLIKPSSPQTHHHHITHLQTTPEIGPIDHRLTELMMSPAQQGLLTHNINDILEDFILETQNNHSSLSQAHLKKRKHRKTQRYTFDLHMFRLDSQLQKIIEHDEEDSGSYDDDMSSSQQSDEMSEQEQEGRTCNSFMLQNWTSKQKSKVLSQRDTQQQKRSTFDISIVDYSQTIDRYSKNPKNEIIKRLREIQFNQEEADEQQKRIMIKKHLQKYLLQYQIFCYEESSKELNLNLSSAINAIIRGIEQTFNKKIAFLPFESRRVKILKYLQKKKKRIWRKKISYDCRKKVADGRLRIKGKFVTREQACQQLGMASLDSYSAQEIKEMLQRRIDESLNQQLVC